MESVHATSGRVMKYNYVCGVCEKVFVSGKALGCHQKCHTTARDAEFKCDICNTPFTRHSSLVRHQKCHVKTYAVQHSPFKCLDCNTPFTCRGDVTQHQKRAHPKQSGGGSVLIAPAVDAGAFSGACRVVFFKFISDRDLLIFICFYIQTLSWMVDGMDPRVVLEHQKAKVLAVVALPQKWYLVLRVEMEREGTMTTVGFRNKALVAMEPTSLVGQYDAAKDEVLKNIETFKESDSGWIINAVKKLELRTVKYKPL